MVGRCVFALCFALGLAGDVDAGQELPAPSPAVRWQVRNTTRLETWRFFEPSVGGGQPHCAFLANRLLLGLDYVGLRLDAHRLRLTSASDLWYSGSGATQRVVSF